MKAIVKEKPGHGAALRDVEMPKPGPKDVLIKVQAGAICGSDLHLYEWNDWARTLNPSLPHILGHEFAGEIMEVGKEVHLLKPGDHVAGETHIPCDNCYFCLTGKRHICSNMKAYGVHTTGIFSEFTTIPEPCAVKIPEEIPYTTAALMEPFGVAVHALSMGVVSGKTLAIFGCGPIGIFAVQAAVAYGAEKIFAIDLSDNRLKMAKSFGATKTINPTQNDPESIILEETKGIGTDWVLEISGSQRAYDQGLSVLRKAGTFAVIGLPSKPIYLDVINHVMFKEAKILGISGREMYETWYRVLGLIRSGKVDLEKVITHRLAPEQFEEGFLIAEKARDGKVEYLFA